MAILLATNFDAAELAAWWPELQRALPGERNVDGLSLIHI